MLPPFTGDHGQAREADCEPANRACVHRRIPAGRLRARGASTVRSVNSRAAVAPKGMPMTLRMGRRARGIRPL